MIIKQGTEDGFIDACDATWPPTTKTAYSTEFDYYYGCSLEYSEYYIVRTYLRFDTSLIPAGAKITSCKLWLKLLDKYNADNFNVALLLLKAAADWNPLDTGDWGCGVTLVASKAYADLPAAGEWFSLNIDPSYLNLSGYTAFEIKGDHESGTAPTGINEGYIYSAQNEGNEPYLQITLSTDSLIDSLNRSPYNTTAYNTIGIGVAPTLEAFHIIVGGQWVPSLIGSPSIEDRIQERSVARFAARDDNGTFTFKRGMPVSIRNIGNEKIFTGFVDSASEVVIPGSSAKIHSISCIDNHYLADKRVVAKVYFNRTAGYIVNDLITTYLAEEGITAGTIEDGPTFTNTVFSYISVSQAIGSLAEKSGNFWWYIDLDRKLHFRPFTALPAPWTASASDMKEGSISLDHGNPKYRNRQIVTGIKEITDPQVEYHKGDGHAQSFTVGYPIHSVPTVKVNGVTKTVGIKGLDTGKDWYWSKGDLIITQDTMGTVLTDTDTLEIDYIGEFDAVIISTDYGAVEKQKAAEGVGTGYVEDVVNEPGTQDEDAAFLTASMLLAKYATDGRHLKFATRRSGLAPGQLLIVNLPDYGLNNVEMLIESVITDEREGVVYYHIVAAEGPEQGSWTRFFATMAQMIQAGPTDVSTATILIIPVDIAETWDWSETTNVTVYACPILPFILPFTLC